MNDIEIIFKALSSGANANANESRRRRENITVYVVHAQCTGTHIECLAFAVSCFSNSKLHRNDIHFHRYTPRLHGVSMELS